MSVPESIRAVERPKGTVVVDNIREGPNRWAVRVLAEVRFIEGKKNPQPHWGKTIGHIIDGRFVPIVPPMHTVDQEGNRVVNADNRQYGFAKLIEGVVSDIKEDLLKVYPAKTAYEILVIATLRVIYPGVPDCRLRYYYNKTFVSIQYKGVALSSKSVHNLFEEIGASMERRGEFSLQRLERVANEDHVAIDGMLKQDNGDANDLGNFAGKSRVKGRKEISILYAYDIELGEPICGEVFPGNFVDSNAYLPFIQHNHITKGILVDDKGFLPTKIEGFLKQHPDLHFITPIKRNDKRIAQYNLLKWVGVLNRVNRIVYYSKARTKEGHYLYAFKDLIRTEGEDALFGIRAIKHENFDADKHQEKESLYGVIVFESDLDISPELVYKTYDDRWQLEMVFRSYKSALELDETRSQDDYVVIGSDFVNVIASIITCRVLRKIGTTDLFRNHTYADIREHLSLSWRVVDAPDPVTYDGYWVHTNNEDYEILEKLGLSAPNPDHPLKPKGKQAQTKKSKKTKEAEQNTSQTSSVAGEDSGAEGSVGSTQETKRGPGRPRKNPPKDPNASKGKPGRPRKNPPKDPNAPKGKPGRPRIHPPKDPNAPKGKPGRPRIHPPKDPNAPKGKPGRPRKEQAAAS